jgi:phosphoglycolate phosphatase-like HAD superfamily hydrolase
MANEPVLVLDFDGVLCNSLTECLLVTWNSYQQQDLALFSDQGLAQIPEEFLQRFKQYRSFSRHLGHFLVSMLATEQPPFKTQQEFDDAFTACIDQRSMEDFVQKATQYRARVRQEKRKQWLAYHELYPQIKETLQECAATLYVVTARDEASVREILEYHGLPLRWDQIFGEQTTKLAALAEIQQREQTSSLYFFDDHLLNVLAAEEAGYRAYWAMWGYHTPEHVQIARQKGVKALQLNDFVELLQILCE